MFNFSNDRQGIILEAALSVFLTYGFKKTSMDDIARQADMSRPALYQLFKNKTDIFRALSQDLMANALLATRQAFELDADFRDQLFASIDNSILELHKFCDASPHGMELIGVNQEIARDIEHAWKIKMIDTIAAGIDKAAAVGKVDLSRFSNTDIGSQSVARIVMHGMEGMRESYLSGEAIEPYVDELIDFVSFSIAPQKVSAAFA